MHIDDVTKFFGNAAKACDAINTSHSNFSKWKKRNNGIVPANHAVSFVIASGHQLDMRWEDYLQDMQGQTETQQAA
ncbi:hypothetical protein ACK35Y_20020 [Aeromonas veronii]|uniref:hypothetical protein n=1 Tax=Aeromonas TaxID=642 RepID=UPI0034A185F5